MRQDVTAWSDAFVEGNAWHYVWGAPHDVDGMVEVQHGGDTDAWLARMRNAYFRLRRIEYWRDATVYRLLGVPYFKRYVPTSGDLVSRWRGKRRLPPGGLAVTASWKRPSVSIQLSIPHCSRELATVARGP